MYMTDAAQNQEDVDNIHKAMKSGKKDGIQIIPLSEVAAKDEFLNIKNVSRDDMMALYRRRCWELSRTTLAGSGTLKRSATCLCATN